MPFDGGGGTDETIIKWLTGRLDRLERMIDDLNVRINQFEHRLLLPPRVELGGWQGLLLVIAIAVAASALIALVYFGGSSGG